MKRPKLWTALMLLATMLLTGCGYSSSTPTTVRIATFNTALSRDTQGALAQAMVSGEDDQAKLVAEVLQRTRPDVVVLQEFDLDLSADSYTNFISKYLAVSQNEAEPIRYDYVYAPPVNTGVLAEVDLDGDGKITRPNDAFGYGLFEGQYGMVVLSKYPIDHEAIRTFRDVRWEELPNNSMPRDYYSPAVSSRLRLSSKTHADVPVTIGPTTLHLLISHPTPPVFDGPEDRNGRRNYDEIGLWLHYLDPPQPVEKRTLPFPRLDETHPDYPTDVRSPGTSFVILGDLNADPNDGESRPGAIQRLLDHERINNTFAPTSEGAIEAARLQAGANLTHKTDPATDTADWNDDPERGSGNLRVDYVLPSVDLIILGSGVYWPKRDDPHAYLNKASDHKLVWVDVQLR